MMDDIVTGETAVCVNCDRTITAVVDPYSGMVDWGDNGDFGCFDSPDTDDEGTGSHDPGEGHTPLGFNIRERLSPTTMPTSGQ
jgi:hypothetical protein